MITALYRKAVSVPVKFHCNRNKAISQEIQDRKNENDKRLHWRSRDEQKGFCNQGSCSVAEIIMTHAPVLSRAPKDIGIGYRR